MQQALCPADIALLGTGLAELCRQVGSVLPKLSKRGTRMNKSKRIASATVVLTVLLSLSACGGMSRQGKNTAIGAGVGAVGGAVLTGGSTLGTVGGAAVGGVVGHEASK